MLDVLRVPGLLKCIRRPGILQELLQYLLLIRIHLCYPRIITVIKKPLKILQILSLLILPSRLYALILTKILPFLIGILLYFCLRDSLERSICRCRRIHLVVVSLLFFRRLLHKSKQWELFLRHCPGNLYFSLLRFAYHICFFIFLLRSRRRIIHKFICFPHIKLIFAEYCLLFRFG